MHESYPTPGPIDIDAELRSGALRVHATETTETTVDLDLEAGVDPADVEVTMSGTTLRIHVGGGSEKLGTATGIHWHMNIANEVEYIATDDKRQVIPYVRVKDRTGAVREYFAEGVTAEQLAKG